MFAASNGKRCKKSVVNWCPEPESNRHADFSARDFKSLVSTYSTIRAVEHRNMEAGVGIEPAYTALQAAA